MELGSHSFWFIIFVFIKLFSESCSKLGCYGYLLLIATFWSASWLLQTLQHLLYWINKIWDCLSVCVCVGILAAETKAAAQSTGRRTWAEGEPGPTWAHCVPVPGWISEHRATTRLPALHSCQTGPAHPPAPPGRPHPPGRGATVQTNWEHEPWAQSPNRLRPLFL